VPDFACFGLANSRSAAKRSQQLRKIFTAAQLTRLFRAKNFHIVTAGSMAIATAWAAASPVYLAQRIVQKRTVGDLSTDRAARRPAQRVRTA
jgi:hypothetical protein